MANNATTNVEWRIPYVTAILTMHYGTTLNHFAALPRHPNHRRHAMQGQQDRQTPLVQRLPYYRHSLLQLRLRLIHKSSNGVSVPSEFHSGSDDDCDYRDIYAYGIGV